MKTITSALMVAAFLVTQVAHAAPGTNETPGASPPKPAPSRKVGVDEFEKLWKDKNNIVLDVRTKKEFEAGHIPGAINLDFMAPSFAEKVAALDTNKVYLVHCAAGRRSASATDQMSKMGFTKLIDLSPGFRAWEKAGKPVEK